MLAGLEWFHFLINHHIFLVGETEKIFEFVNSPLVAFLIVQLLQNKDLDNLCVSDLSITLSFYNFLPPSPFIFPLDSVYVTFASEQFTVSSPRVGLQGGG